MVSSAVYRYFPSRDDLLTALIVDSYLSLGVQSQAAARAAGDGRAALPGLSAMRCATGRRPPARVGAAVRQPGARLRRAERHVDPAGVAPLAFFGVVADGVAPARSRSVGALPRPLRADMARLRDDTGLDIPDDVLVRSLGAWATLLGLVSVELFGHTHNVITDHAAFFDTQPTRPLARSRGLTGGDADGQMPSAALRPSSSISWPPASLAKIGRRLAPRVGQRRRRGRRRSPATPTRWCTACRGGARRGGLSASITAFCTAGVRADRAGLADALGAERVERRRRLRACAPRSIGNSAADGMA